jgi:NTP pyrophosphatase (non-canonical NTP hydrolase)
VTLAEFQDTIAATFGDKDRRDGIRNAIAWLAEEVGELSQASRKGTKEQQLHELGDVLAWTVSIAAQLGLSCEEAVARYANGCPKCASKPCAC